MTKCNSCGTCCKLFVINLNEEEYRSGFYKTMFDEQIPDFVEAELTGSNLLSQNDDGSCIYLKENKCSIHDKRPNVCKPFFCDSNESRFKLVNSETS